MRDIHETPDKHPLIVRIGVSITNIEGNSTIKSEEKLNYLFLADSILSYFRR